MPNKIIYFGTDLLSSCIDVFLRFGHSIDAFYIGDDEENAASVCDLAQALSATVHRGRPTTKAMEAHIDGGADFFFSADYGYKIPLPRGLKYGVNLHTSLLPMGRGATPLPYLVTEHPDASGLTLHKLSDTFDAGDILLNCTVPVSPDDSLNSLSVKMSLRAPALLETFLKDPAQYYANAESQECGESWPPPSVDSRMLDWSLPVTALSERIRSFGHFGAIVLLDNQYWRVAHAEAVEYDHGKEPGTLIFKSKDLFAITCFDGFVVVPRSALILI